MSNATVLEQAQRAAYGRTMAMPLERAEHRCFRTVVAGVRRPAPGTVRLTLRAEELQTYRPLGPDEFVGFVMPAPGMALPPLPTEGAASPRGAFDHLPESQRPSVRWYTVRRHRPADGEVDVDVVTHGDAGPGSAWVLRAAPGDVLGVQTGTSCYRTAGAVGTHLIVGDETAVPAVSAILEQLPPGVRARVVVEVPGREVVPPLPEVARAQTTVLERGDLPPGSALLPALRGMGTVADLAFAWVCGEQAAVAAARRHIVRERGLDRRSVYFCGYWILGRPRG